MSFLLELRNAAKIEREEGIRFNLKLLADELQSALKALVSAPTADNMKTVNGKWAQAYCLLEAVKNRPGSDPSGAGLKEDARLAA